MGSEAYGQREMEVRPKETGEGRKREGLGSRGGEKGGGGQEREGGRRERKNTQVLVAFKSQFQLFPGPSYASSFLPSGYSTLPSIVGDTSIFLINPIF